MKKKMFGLENIRGPGLIFQVALAASSSHDIQFEETVTAYLDLKKRFSKGKGGLFPLGRSQSIHEKGVQVSWCLVYE